ncbi:hypothetical protein JM18_004890 [Phytophthora kernoviae]|uniref:Adenosine deaminase domain-containing protein n=2 Tax=Phytophthora kernoviae TaxID=325452 RepID=A0A8T0LY97_9STRA|nr:hypothetical protein G195_003912 [Phytophthora kernoviae 00238/432]KAG2523729.1 hypothetical protein JM16_004961 [Phytophthora kernoviae]KAG2525534.1 hypothetical protein JM18_004890 [Phytophthora kernoviae]
MEALTDDRLAAYCKALPKVELHAHIHGSIRPSTLEEIVQEEARLNGSTPLQLPKNRSLDECFEMFGLIHQVVVSRRVLRRIVIEAVEDFAAENVKYLELRSTPRDLPRDGATRAEYVGEVVSALEECRARQDLDIEVRLLLSINRNQPVSTAEETVNMALERRNQQNCPFIVGIDLSGNSERPNSEFYRFEQVLERARKGGLKLAVHFAEHFDEEEAMRILRFRPDRLGHACCLPETLYAKMVAMRIPVEICLTSNSADIADAFCGEQNCLNALRMLFYSLPNCRYELWGLKYSASKFLNHCAVASAQSSTTSGASASLSSASGSSSSSMSAELAAIPECTNSQLNAAQETLTTNQREAQCESALNLDKGTMLQVTTAQASEICDETSCKAALQELYNALPNCRYQLWGLQYSAKQLLEHCGVTPTNTTSSTSDSSSGSVGWSVLKSSSASFASAGETPTPTTASSTASESSAASASSSDAVTTTTTSVALAATAGVIAAFLA